MKIYIYERNKKLAGIKMKVIHEVNHFTNREDVKF